MSLEKIEVDVYDSSSMSCPRLQVRSGAWSGHYRYFLFQDNTFLANAYAFFEASILGNHRDLRRSKFAYCLHPVFIRSEEVAWLDIDLPQALRPLIGIAAHKGVECGG